MEAKMINELENKLYKKYPTIFRQKDLSPTETRMCDGICVGDGWYTLIDCLCNELLTDNSFIKKETDEPPIEVFQIKEKFGGLRFYAENSTEKQNTIINFAESLSHKICENCGTFSDDVKLTKTGWKKNLCSKCNK